jgi:hypothetical protein
MMKIPSWLKIILWLALIGFFSWLLSQRYNAIITGTSNAFDIILFLIWIALIAALIFQEVDLFGVKLKREIDNLKSEFKEQIINLRSDIQTINMKTEVNPQITVGVPSSDSELKDFEKNVKPIIERALEEHGKNKIVAIPEELDVPDNTVFLFKVRYAIENELRRIEYNWWLPREETRYQTSLTLARNLFNNGVIVSAALNLIQEIYNISSQAIHGTEVTDTSVQFVREMSSTLLAYLKSIKKPQPPWLQQAMRNWKPESDNKIEWKPKEHKL